MPITALHEKIAATPFIDTHEHLLEERTRLWEVGVNRYIPCTDAALLLRHYAGDDLHVAGMPVAERERFYAPDVAPAEKWRLLAPYWPRCRYTGTLEVLARCVEAGWLHGTPARERPAWQFIYVIQNHDQVGNRAFGERLHHQIDMQRYRAASTLLLSRRKTPPLSSPAMRVARASDRRSGRRSKTI